MSPVPEQNPTIPAVYPRPSPMSSMYPYFVVHAVVEFSAVLVRRSAISRQPVDASPVEVAHADCGGGVTVPGSVGTEVSCSCQVRR